MLRIESDMITYIDLCVCLHIYNWSNYIEGNVYCTCVAYFITDNLFCLCFMFYV